MGSCSKVISDDQLIGGKWLPKSGYKEGKPSGDPVCPPFDKGIEFKDEKTVYVQASDKNFTYNLRESDDGMEISFYNPNGELDIFKIIIEHEDYLALIGFGPSKSYHCYFERMN